MTAITTMKTNNKAVQYFSRKDIGIQTDDFFAQKIKDYVLLHDNFNCKNIVKHFSIIGIRLNKKQVEQVLSELILSQQDI